MIRNWMVFFLGAALLATLGLPFVVLHPGEFVLGGDYHITSEAPLERDVSFYFAQVTVDEGARVDGQMYLYSSTLDLHGVVTKGIHAFESDLTIHDTARVEGEIDQNAFIHWTLLLPAIALFP